MQNKIAERVVKFCNSSPFIFLKINFYPLVELVETIWNLARDGLDKLDQRLGDILKINSFTNFHFCNLQRVGFGTIYLVVNILFFDWAFFVAHCEDDRADHRHKKNRAGKLEW